MFLGGENTFFTPSPNNKRWKEVLQTNEAFTRIFLGAWCFYKLVKFEISKTFSLVNITGTSLLKSFEKLGSFIVLFDCCIYLFLRELRVFF